MMMAEDEWSSEVIANNRDCKFDGGPWMNMVKASLASILLMLLVACASNSDDFMIKGSQRQLIPLQGVTEVIVRCYCPKRMVNAGAVSSDISVKVSGAFGSSGYHGKQDKPKMMPDGYLRFVVRREGQRMTLESHEFTYLHHAQLLSAVTISVPQGVEVRFETLSRDDLYDRTVN